ncbi:hypothetical protein [Flavobacterium chilense]|uniref:Uncharacterized protein n=1 Tax=Flavobacterium chilense TaxID=946677 RepID=A0A1M7LJ38_9FLAO|nr:hypothetical protein [Flavobacterium chilense]SHM78026.1 hypothetical protein SAMN05444484_109135 [Flavobacterium chilense]
MINFDLSNTKDVISILANLATFFTAIIAIIAIFQVKKQRLSSYKPEIILDSFVAFFFADKFLSKKNNFAFKTCKYSRNDQKEKKEVQKHISVYYLLQNIGFGTAKYVEGHWEFDYKKASKILKQMFPDNFKFEEDHKGFYFRDEAKDVWIFFDSESLARQQSIDYLLPESNGENGKGQTVPRIIMDCHIYYTVLKHKINVGVNKELVYEEFLEMPKPIFKINYRDFNDKKHTKTFELSFKYAGNDFEVPDQDPNDCGIFYIDVREK